MTIDDFYSDEANQTNFIDRMAAFLKVSYDRVRIVGIRKSNNLRNLQ